MTEIIRSGHAPFKLQKTACRPSSPDGSFESSYQRLSRTELRVASYMLLGIGISTVLATTYLIFVSYTRVPYWDEWVALISYRQWPGKLHLGWIWEQHNEHRMVWQKLLFWLDYQFLKASEWPMFAAIIASQFTLLALIALMLRRFGKFGEWPFRCAVGVALYCLFCPSQWENYTWAFQVAFVLVNLLVFSAIILLLQYASSRRLVWLIASIGVSCAATFCNGNGPLVWPAVLLAAVLLSLGWPHIVLLIVCGFLSTALYLHNYRMPSNHGLLAQSLSNPLQVVEYLENYFGSSFLPSRHLDWSVQVGIIAIVLGVPATFIMVRHLWRKQRIFVIGLLSPMFYLFLTAI